MDTIQYRLGVELPVFCNAGIFIVDLTPEQVREGKRLYIALKAWLFAIGREDLAERIVFGLKHR